MKKLIFLLIFLNIALYLNAVEISKKEKIVVIPFKNLSSEKMNAGNKLASSLAGNLSNLGRFEIIDRTELEKIMEEQKLILMGVVEQAYEVGKISSSKMAFSGTILAINLYRKEKKKDDIIKIVELLKNKEIKKEYEKEWNIDFKVNFKVINVETGKTLESFQRSVYYRTEKVHTKEAALDEAIRIISDQAIDGMRNIFKLKTYIISKDKRDVVIRLGRDMGIKKGMEFKIYDKDKRIEDKFSEESFKVTGKKKGLLYINSVDEKVAYAKIVRGASKVEIGDSLSEKMYSSINIELSLGTVPFKIKGSDEILELKVENNGQDYKAKINYSQEDKERTPYLNINLGPAYRTVRPSVDLMVYLNSPMAVYGLDINLDLAKSLGDYMELSAGIGLGGRYARGKIGDVVKDGSSNYWDNIANGEDINLESISYAAKLKVKGVFYINDISSVILEAGYMYSKITNWDAKTKTISGEEIELDSKFSDAVGELDMSGVYVGLGLRWTF